MLERGVEPRPGAQFPIGISLLELDKRLAAAVVTTTYAAISFKHSPVQSPSDQGWRLTAMIYAISASSCGDMALDVGLTASR